MKRPSAPRLPLDLEFALELDPAPLSDRFLRVPVHLYLLGRSVPTEQPIL